MGKEYISDIYQEVYHVPYFNLQVNIDNNVTDLLLIENNLYFRPCISLGFGQNNSIGTWYWYWYEGRNTFSLHSLQS